MSLLWLDNTFHKGEKMENWQLVNLELSKKIKELGVKQESIWWWCKFKEYSKCDGVHLGYSWGLSMGKLTKKDCDDVEEYISAFTVAELGKMLPNWYETHTVDKPNLWVCQPRGLDPDEHPMMTEADTEANARAKMLIYLKEKKNAKT